MECEKKRKFLPKNKWVVNKLKIFFMEAKRAEDEYRHSLRKIEEKMQRVFKMEELELLIKDGQIEGIGTPKDPKILKTVTRVELEGV